MPRKIETRPENQCRQNESNCVAHKVDLKEDHDCKQSVQRKLELKVPDLFPCGGGDEEETYRRLRELIHEEVEQLISAGKELAVPVTRPMREAAGA